MSDTSKGASSLPDEVLGQIAADLALALELESLSSEELLSARGMQDEETANGVGRAEGQFGSVTGGVR